MNELGDFQLVTNSIPMVDLGGTEAPTKLINLTSTLLKTNNIKSVRHHQELQVFEVKIKTKLLFLTLKYAGRDEGRSFFWFTLFLYVCNLYLTVLDLKCFFQVKKDAEIQLKLNTTDDVNGLFKLEVHVERRHKSSFEQNTPLTMKDIQSLEHMSELITILPEYFYSFFPSPVLLTLRRL